MGKSTAVGLLILLSSLALAGTPAATETTESSNLATADLNASLRQLARLGISSAFEAPSAGSGLDAVADLLEARHLVRGHDTSMAQAAAHAAAQAARLDAAGDDAAFARALHQAGSSLQQQHLNAQTDAATVPSNTPLIGAVSDDVVLTVLDLAARFNAEPTPEELLHLLDLRQLPQDIQAALVQTINAFVAFDEANTQVNTASDLAQLVTARNNLLDAGEALRTSFSTSSATTSTVPYAVDKVISIDAGPGGNIYTDDYRLLIDAGGDDTYLNNAGGSGLLVTPCHSLSGRTAAALFDLRGNDRYISQRSCGTNGGGFGGAGFLYDAQGNDVYRGGSKGSNGGAAGWGVGTLVDLGGDDRYEAGSRAVNGGGADDGLGLLVDARGNDVYQSARKGVNGGGITRGLGILIDGSGDDTYTALDQAVNGGGHQQGAGFLLDMDGNDRYEGSGKGTNGGANEMGTGFLADLRGIDTYLASGPGTNGGGSAGGVGVLYDFEGHDTYTAGHRGVNGGGYAGGLGALFDIYGNDKYLASQLAVNGGAMDADWGDTEFCPAAGSCFRMPASWGLLLDVNGEDDFAEDSASSSGRDRSVFPKGTVGAQLDFVPQVE